MTLRQLEVELDFAVEMAKMTRSLDWLPIVEKLDAAIKARFK